jgi:hypothetical protein
MSTRMPNPFASRGPPTENRTQHDVKPSSAFEVDQPFQRAKNTADLIQTRQGNDTHQSDQKASNRAERQSIPCTELHHPWNNELIW